MPYNFPMQFKVFVDADSMTPRHRKIILRRATKGDIDVSFVADRSLKDVLDAIESHTISLRGPFRGTMGKEGIRQIKSKIKMVVVETGANAADDYIACNVSSGDLVVTHDIPLSERCINKGAVAIDDRGNIYTKENISERLSVRQANACFREMGITLSRSERFDMKTINKFASAFDSVLSPLGL